MRHILLVLSALFALSTICPSHGAPSRALWVWRSASIRESVASQTQFFEFLAAPHGDKSKAITVVFFDGVRQADFANTETVANLRRFIKEAHKRKLRVDFLTGDPSWALEATQAQGVAYTQAVIDFNRGGDKSERYDGIQYDVEPYALPEWRTQRDVLESGLLGLFDKSRALIKTSGQKLLLTAALPRWYGAQDGRVAYKDVVDRLDEIDVMDYVTTSTHLTNDPAAILKYASATHKKVWIGVETGELKETPRSTFFDLGETAMESVFSQSLAALVKEPSFAGYAVHHWASYTGMKP